MADQLTLNQMLALLPDNSTGDIEESDMRAIVTALYGWALTIIGNNNKFLGASYTMVPSPNGSYADNETVPGIPGTESTESVNAYTDLTLGTDKLLTNGTVPDPSNFTIGHLGFDVATGTVVIRVDAGSAMGGNLFQVFGMYGSDSIGRPTAVKVEYSDNDSSWTTLEDRTGLTGSAGGGRKYWRADFDASGAGSHRYWRVTTTGFSSWTFLGEIALVD